MNIVQSFWSKPLIHQQTSNLAFNHYAGWPSLELLLSSWALSCLTLNELYPNKILYTDNFGKKVLIDFLGLPYSDCKLVLNEINHFDISLWAIGKMSVYSLQDDPFLHIDGDIFIWEKFSDDFTSGSIVAQSIEKDPNLYDTVLDQALKNLHSFPPEAEKFVRKTKGNFGINTGVFGGKDIELIKAYSIGVIEFIEKNLDLLKNLKIKNINMFFEQFLLLCFAEYFKKKVTFLFDDLSNDFSEILNFHLIPFDLKYIHTVGKAKWDLLANEQIVLRLQMDYPIFYERIQNSLPAIESLLLKEKLK